MNQWDSYFWSICCATANNSKCMSRRIGVVITKDNSVISTGYNGPPRDTPHCNVRYIADEHLHNHMVKNHATVLMSMKSPEDFCPRKLMGYKTGEGLEWCTAQHAETNAIINAARLGIMIKDSTMYMNTGMPCKNCLGAIINAGISELVIRDMSYYDDISRFLVREAKLKIREFDINS